MTGNAAICKEIVLTYMYKMAKKPNEEANSQLSQLDEKELQKLGVMVEIMPGVAPWPAMIAFLMMVFH